MTDRITVDVKAVETALREYLSRLDYDLHKSIERDEETGDDTYDAEAEALFGYIQDAARQASGQPAAEDCPSCEVGIEHAGHCPTPETHNWGCGCPTDRQGAVGQQDATQPTTDETEQTARDDLYDALDQSWYRWDPQSMAKGTAIIRLIDAYRAAILNSAADAVAAHPEAQDEHMGGMDRAADIVRRLATGAES